MSVSTLIQYEVCTWSMKKWQKLIKNEWRMNKEEILYPQHPWYHRKTLKTGWHHIGMPTTYRRVAMTHEYSAVPLSFYYSTIPLTAIIILHTYRTHKLRRKARLWRKHVCLLVVEWYCSSQFFQFCRLTESLIQASKSSFYGTFITLSVTEIEPLIWIAN